MIADLSLQSLQSNSNLLQSNAAYTPGLRTPSINVETAPSLHKSTSMSSEEYHFDIVPPVRVSLVPFYGLVVYQYYLMTVTPHLEYLLRRGQYSRGYHKPAWYVERGGCTSSAFAECRESTGATLSHYSSFCTSPWLRSFRWPAYAVSVIHPLFPLDGGWS
jgi:hypothetical protein